MQAMTPNTNEPDEIARAEQDVARSRAELTRSLRQVGKSSENLARRLGDELKPAITTVAVVAGGAALVGVTIAVVRRARGRRGWLGPERPSALGTAAKAVGLWALRFIARRVAQEVVSRLSVPTEPAPAAAPAAE